MVGGEHHLRASMSIERVEHGLGEPGSRVRAQGTDEDELRGRYDIGVTPAHAPVAAGGSHALPVRGAIHRAVEALRVDEGLKQQQPMAEARRPIRHHASLAQRKKARCEIGAPPTRQNHKPRVVAHQVQPVILHPLIPTNPGVTRPALPCRRGPAHQRHPLIMPAPDVPPCLADLGQRTEIMVRLHQVLVASLKSRSLSQNKNSP